MLSVFPFCFQDSSFYYGNSFLALAQTEAFVDKTMFIRQALEAAPRLLITAPRKFGKSTNLNMLRIFLSKNSSRVESIRRTFKSLQIARDDVFYFENFAKHPVVYLNLKAEITGSYRQALGTFRRALHEAYVEHEYMEYSKALSTSEQLLCQKWCGERSFIKMNEELVVSGLDSLVRMVKKCNLNTKVVLLIDEYDSVISNALFQVDDTPEFKEIVSLVSDVLFALLKDTDDRIRLAVLTGLSHFSTPLLSEVNSLRGCDFLGDHPFVKFYGLAETEVASLYAKPDFQHRSKYRESIEKMYNGYVSEGGRRVYNTYSFLRFLNTGRRVIHWHTDSYFTRVIDMIKFNEIAYIYDMLLKNERVYLRVQRKVSWTEIENLKKMYSYGIPPVNADLLLSHFLELGLLTYTRSNDTRLEDGEVQVKIPNREVHNLFFNSLKKYFNGEQCNLPMSRAVTYPAFKKFLEKMYKSKHSGCKPIIEALLEGKK